MPVATESDPADGALRCLRDGYSGASHARSEANLIVRRQLTKKVKK